MNKTRGRPKKAPEESLVERVDLRLSTEEKRRFEAVAEQTGSKLSAWIRDTLAHAAKKAGH